MMDQDMVGTCVAGTYNQPQPIERAKSSYLRFTARLAAHASTAKSTWTTRWIGTRTEAGFALFARGGFAEGDVELLARI